MSEKWKSQFNSFITLLLRLGFVSYLLFTVYPYISNPGFESEFPNWIIRWGLIILLGAVFLLSMVMKRSDFFRYGFFIVLIAAAFNLFVVFLKPGTLSYSLVHFYVIVTAVYFVSRDIRHDANIKRKHHKNRDKNH
ncbi:MAG TPA: hypothetical protein PKV88_00685 [Bacteroidales bacterium]|jgi:hypothetical protein|nr:hypothetical protein [Bacteroidales bacterium]MDD4085725.1 hypothetical protein [Bacteroidales bacterium]MDY0085260.1 hypothetical protein [Bacteroidales bacterium]HPE42569.1 hypothetical protein [Bacteroidales bacterium]